jgi:hypothetical protein
VSQIKDKEREYSGQERRVESELAVREAQNSLVGLCDSVADRIAG